MDKKCIHVLIIFVLLEFSNLQSAITNESSFTSDDIYEPDDFAYTSIEKIYVCKGEENIITIPDEHYVVYVVDSFYGVTEDQSCLSINPQNCKMSFKYICESSEYCKVALSNDTILPNCGNKTADYIQLRYRFIPLQTKYMSSICDENYSNFSEGASGMLVSEDWSLGISCNKEIRSPPGTFIRVYLIDVPFLHELCESAYLQLKSECDTVIYCDNTTAIDDGIHEFKSCSNYMTITYNTSIDEFFLYKIYYEVIREDGPSIEFSNTICPNSSEIIKCNRMPATKYTPLFTQIMYGLRNDSICEYRKEDCLEPSNDFEDLALPEQYIQVTFYDKELSSCEHKLATYFHFEYKCIPSESSTLSDYNICDKNLKEITEQKGFISSPFYPKYATVSEDCVQRIVAPENKTINVWFASININPGDDANGECLDSYVRIMDGNDTYTFCGLNKPFLENKLCSSDISISYRALTPISTTLSGFRLYYSFQDRNTQIICANVSTTLPPTTLITSTQVPSSSEITRFQKAIICSGNKTTLKIPNGYLLFIIDSFYGVTNDQSCKSINPQNCKLPFKYTCESLVTCDISLLNDVILTNCANRKADYIQLLYRFIPLQNEGTKSICEDGDIKINESEFNIIASPNYPSYNHFLNCKRKILTSPDSYVRIYLSDISIEPPDNSDGQCTRGYLQLTSECDSVMYCGERAINGSYEYKSCSNYINVSYVSTNSDFDLRGFNIFVESFKDDGPSGEYTNEVCVSSDVNIRCKPTQSTNYTAFLIEEFYGIGINQSLCEYRDGDCTLTTDELEFYLLFYEDDDVLFPSWIFPANILPNCQNQRAIYFHYSYRCLPVESTTISNYNICDDTLIDITESKGFISSPLYPGSTLASCNCTKRIRAAENKTVNIWIMSFRASQHTNDAYVVISDSGTRYEYKGVYKHSLENKLCSSQIYVNYQAFFINNDYSAFRLYYEIVPRSTQSECTNVSTLSSTSTTSLTFQTSETTDSTISLASEQKTTFKKPTSGYVTIKNDELKALSSTHFITWTLGIGVPVIVVILILAFVLIKRSKRISQESFEFSKLNANTDNLTAFKNQNFS